VTREARQFYLRYYMLTQILPAYCMALLSYSSAGLLALTLWRQTLLTGGLAAVTVLFVFIGLSRLIAWIGFLLSGVARARITPASEDVERVAPYLDEARQLHLPVELQVVELGAAPYVAAGGFVGNELWISTHALRTLPATTLRAVLLHELGHIARGLRGCAWHDLTWALAYLVAYLLAPVPLLILAAALIHTSIWLHCERWMRMQIETQADRWAAGEMGQMEYAKAISVYLALFERSGARTLTRERLRRCGLSSEEIKQVLS
jgi:Zn-dependent protease with chaperone function